MNDVVLIFWVVVFVVFVVFLIVMVVFWWRVMRGKVNVELEFVSVGFVVDVWVEVVEVVVVSEIVCI